MTAPHLSRRGLVLGTGAFATSALLASCGNGAAEKPPAPPTGPALAEPTPVATTEQFTTVTEQIHAAVKAADEARDAKKLAPRVVGTAAEFRQKTYAMIAKVGEFSSTLQVPGAELIIPMTSTGGKFPRTAIALVSGSEKGKVPFFMALQQKDARSPYTTWGWAQQAAGIPMPNVEAAEVGAAPVSYEQDDLLLTPKAALDLYAKVLSDGVAADPKKLMGTDPFMTTRHKEIGDERKALNAGVNWDEAATVKEVYTVKKGDFVGIRTAPAKDAKIGGAIVMGTLLSNRRVLVKEGATMAYSQDNPYTKLIGKKKFTKEFRRDFGTVVALYIPPKGAKAKIQPIGATIAELGASGS